MEKGALKMLALEMEKTQTKEFMSRLLKEDLFDGFEARVVEIVTAERITVDTTPNSPPWNETRPLIYSIIKLCPKPTQIKIVFSYTNAQEIHTNAAALFLNTLYENDTITFTTAVSQKEFALDKTTESAWDTFIKDFFIKAKLMVKDRT
jgi:hypothetical protein